MTFTIWQTFTLVAGLVSSAGSGSDDVSFTDYSLDFDGEILDWKFVQSASSHDLAVTIRATGGERALQLFGVSKKGIDRTPRQTIPIHADVLALAFADVRGEAGEELVLLTRSGAWSYSPTLSGYRDNAQRLADYALVYDFPDPNALPFWEYVVRGQGERDLVFLPGTDSLSLWGAASAGGDGYELRTAFTPTDEKKVRQKELVQAEESRRGDSKSGGNVSIAFGDRGARELFFDDGKQATSLLSDSRSYRAPALVDVDGDGRVDLLRALEEGLHIHIAGPHGFDSTPTRVESIPSYLVSKETRNYLRDDSVWTLVDLDLDGDVDTIVHWTEDVDGFENAEQKLQILINDGTRLLPAKPNQLLRFEAADLGFETTDVDGDGHVDLAVSKFELPSLLDTVTGLEFTLTNLLYLGKRGGTFEKKPTLRQTQTFDESTIDLAIASRHLRLDADGDGIADVVEIDIHGRIAIRRIIKESRIFGADRWSLDDQPWKRFEVRGGLLSLFVDDWNGDGLLDIVSRGEGQLTILFSSQRGTR